MAQRLSIQNTREWCTTETGAPDPLPTPAAVAASQSPLHRLASSATAASQPGLEILITHRIVSACESFVRT
ncbi:hypothetical protein CRENBAI_007160 [Crenichthys baileyi]|uniref:Uncharacterized protein n=1 Tax=Crenichthys baileyi TaxID=28760 RepID=A0AAV9RMV3_9TELE